MGPSTIQLLLINTLMKPSSSKGSSNAMVMGNEMCSFAFRANIFVEKLTLDIIRMTQLHINKTFYRLFIVKIWGINYYICTCVHLCSVLCAYVCLIVLSFHVFI